MEMKSLAILKYKSWVSLDCFNDINKTDFETLLKDYVNINKKKYKQYLKALDVDYSIIDNYDMIETLERVNKTNGTFNKGSETVLTTNNIQDNSNDSNTTNTTNKQTTTENKDNSETINTTNTLEITKEPTNTVSINSAIPYDSNEYKESDKTATTNTFGKETNNTTNKTTNNGNSNNEIVTNNTNKVDSNIQHNANQSSNGNVVNSERVDSNTQNNTENYTLRRKGNIGTMTSTDVMERHCKFWLDFKGIEIILQDICNNFFIVENGDTYADRFIYY